MLTRRQLPSQGNVVGVARADDPSTIATFATPVSIPCVMPRARTLTLPDDQPVDYYEIALRQIIQQILPVGLLATTVWGYGGKATQSNRGRLTHSAPTLTIESSRGSRPAGACRSLGNTSMVNGSTWPCQTVAHRRYRFRLLNGCQSRFRILDFKAIPGVAVWQIGNENGFLAAPVNITDDHGNRLLLGLSERADVIVDFTNVPIGSHLLGNVGRDEQFGGDVPGVDFPVAYPRTPDDGVTIERTWADPVSENPAVSATEVWEICNTTGEAHPDALPRGRVRSRRSASPPGRGRRRGRAADRAHRRPVPARAVGDGHHAGRSTTSARTMRRTADCASSPRSRGADRTWTSAKAKLRSLSAAVAIEPQPDDPRTRP
jgi:hypothetical protein